MILPKDTDLFHVHTFRCKHAEETGDEEYIALCDAVIAGMESGYFSIVAHPDRSFRKCEKWLPEMDEKSEIIHRLSVAKGIPLEINMGSCFFEKQFWPEFGFFQKYDMILPLHKTNQEN